MSAAHDPDPSRAPLLLERVSTWVVLGGVSLGFAAVFVNRVAPAWVGNIAAVWFLTGFLAGLTTRSTRRGLGLGVLALATATVAYYTVRIAMVTSFTFGDLVPFPAAWLVIGLATGALSGWLGAFARRRPAAWGAPAGAFLGEAMTVIVVRQRVSQAAVEIVFASVCLWCGRSALSRALLVACGVLPNVAAFTIAYRVLLW